MKEYFAVFEHPTSVKIWFIKILKGKLFKVILNPESG
jgi:hypothetical protein